MAKIPLNLDKTNIIPLDIIISGKRGKSVNLKVVFDTGASITTIPQEAAIAIGIEPSNSKKRIEMITASGIEYVPLITIPKVELLGFKVKNLEVACLNLPPQSAVSGLLGINFLKNFDIFLKFRQKTLEIIR